MTVMVWFYEHHDVLSPLKDLCRVVEDDESDEWETDSEEEEEKQDEFDEVRGLDLLSEHIRLYLSLSQ